MTTANPSWLLLRGLTREQGHWGAFVPLLQSALPPGSLVLTPDLPGNGALHLGTSPTRVEDMVEACRAGLLAEGHRPPYSVVAMSLGAMVTVAWAHAYPHELDRCALINTSLRPFSSFWQRLRPGNYPTIARLLATKADARQWEDAILRMTTRHPGTPEQETLQYWLDLRARHPVRVANGLRQLWAAARYHAPRLRPDVPMLILNSLGDQLVDPACSAELARQWQVPLVRHPTAGHDLPLDAAPWVVQQLQLWLASPRSQRPAGLSPAP